MDAFIQVINRTIEAVNNKAGKEDFVDWLLIKAIFEELYVPLQQAFFRRKDKYSFTLKPYQAIALYVVFSGNSEYPIYEANLINGLCGRIHQEIICKS